MKKFNAPFFFRPRAWKKKESNFFIKRCKIRDVFWLGPSGDRWDPAPKMLGADNKTHLESRFWKRGVMCMCTVYHVYVGRTACHLNWKRVHHVYVGRTA